MPVLCRKYESLTVVTVVAEEMPTNMSLVALRFIVMTVLNDKFILAFLIVEILALKFPIFSRVYIIIGRTVSYNNNTGCHYQCIPLSLSSLINCNNITIHFIISESIYIYLSLTRIP